MPDLINLFPESNYVLNPNTCIDQDLRQIFCGPTQTAWDAATKLNMGQLAQGRKNCVIWGTETIHFFQRFKIPAGIKSMYARFVAKIRPQKEETHCVRLTSGSNIVDYTGTFSNPTAKITMSKLLLNSVASTPVARFMNTNIKYFYLNNPMLRYDYMHISIAVIPQEIINAYNLLPLFNTSHVLIENWKVMYGLPQAINIAHDQLAQ